MNGDKKCHSRTRAARREGGADTIQVMWREKGGTQSSHEFLKGQQRPKKG